jgi:hypothetical protein
MQRKSGTTLTRVNRYLKWAFVDAANAICLTRGCAPRHHVRRLPERAAGRQGPPKAIGW